MKFLLMNNNHVVSKLATLSADKASVELVEYDDPSLVPQDNYDVLIFDSEIFSQEFFDELKSRFDFSKTIFIYSSKSKPVEGFDIYLKKPFLPTELVDLISEIKISTDSKPKDDLMDDKDLSIDTPDVEDDKETNDFDDLFGTDEKDSSEDIDQAAAQLDSDLEKSQEDRSITNEGEEIDEFNFDEEVAPNEQNNKEIEKLASIEEDLKDLDFGDDLDGSEFELKEEDSQSDEDAEDAAKEKELKNEDRLEFDGELFENEEEIEKLDPNNASEDKEPSNDISLSESKGSTATDELQLDEELLEDDDIQSDDQASKHYEPSDSLGIDEDELSEVKSLLESSDEDDKVETEKKEEDMSDEVRVKNDEFSSLTEEALSEAVGEDLDFDDELDFGDEEVDNKSDISSDEERTVVNEVKIDNEKKEEKTQEFLAEDSLSNVQQLQNIAGGMNVESIKKILDGMQITINISYPNSKK